MHIKCALFSYSKSKHLISYIFIFIPFTLTNVNARDHTNSFQLQTNKSFIRENLYSNRFSPDKQRMNKLYTKNDGVPYVDIYSRRKYRNRHQLLETYNRKYAVSDRTESVTKDTDFPQHTHMPYKNHYRDSKVGFRHGESFTTPHPFVSYVQSLDSDKYSGKIRTLGPIVNRNVTYWKQDGRFRNPSPQRHTAMETLYKGRKYNSRYNQRKNRHRNKAISNVKDQVKNQPIRGKIELPTLSEYDSSLFNKNYFNNQHSATNTPYEKQDLSFNDTSFNPRLRQHQAFENLVNDVSDDKWNRKFKNVQPSTSLRSPVDKYDHDGTKQENRTIRKANIVFIMADDLDVELGSLNYMPRLLHHLGSEGAMFTHSYTTTPVCCPSRSSMLTGMYIHNHEIFTNHENCSSLQWQNTHEKRSFATYLNDVGYRTGYFGKYLNKYNGTHVPAGWREWAGLLMNSKYYNYTVNRNNKRIKYGNRYPQDYYPHVITNDGLHFLRTTKRMGGDSPFLMVLSYPSPHGPEDSAPEHAHKFFNATDHHTASYNYAPNPDKQWMLQFTDRMPEMQLKFTDVLMTKRLQTLQSMDEAIEKIVHELRVLGELDNTYIFFSSDHGYHLGQFGLSKGKSMPFEFDIKVPLFVRGPGVKPGAQLPQIALNIDLAPTFLSIGGVSPPAHMDGKSLLPILTAADVKWRDSFLVESSGRLREEERLEKVEQRTWERERMLNLASSGGVPRGNIGEGMLSGGGTVNLYTSKHERLGVVCRKETFKAPCTPQQKWHCLKDKLKRWRLKKCRPKSSLRHRHCMCQSPLGVGSYAKLDSTERRRQKNFLKKYVNKDIKYAGPKFIKSFNNIAMIKQQFMKRKHKKLSRYKRSESSAFLNQLFTNIENELRDDPSSFMISNTTLDPSSITAEIMTSGLKSRSSNTSLHVENINLNIDEEMLKDRNVNAFVEDEELRDLQDQITHISDELHSLEIVSNGTATSEASNQTSLESENLYTLHGCQTTAGQVDCRPELYENPHIWRSSKEAVEGHIKRLRQQLITVKNIQRHLREKRPKNANSILVFDDYRVDDEDYFEGSGQFPTDSNYVIRVRETPPHHTDSDLYLEGDENYTNLKKGKLRNLVDNDHVDNADDTSLQLLPIPISYLVDDVSVYKNDASPLPLCWCEKRITQRLLLQEQRSRRREERQKLKEKRQRRRQRWKSDKSHLAMECDYPKVHCYTHDNDHWRTPPLWTDGKLCFCVNSANNTFWCLRTVNATDNFLYCEFITGLISYYNLHIDPYQLRNVAFMLTYEQLIPLHEQLQRLRTCKGAQQCENSHLKTIVDTSSTIADSFPPSTDDSSPLSILPHPSPPKNLLPNYPQPDFTFPLIFNKRNHVWNENKIRKKNKYKKQKQRDKNRKLKKEQKKLKRKKLQGHLLGLPNTYLMPERERRRKVRKSKQRRRNNKKLHRKNNKKNNKGLRKNMDIRLHN